MKKNIYILITVVCLLIVLSQTTVLAHTFGVSKGIMPDSPLYSVDIGWEKVQIFTSGLDNNQTAKLHLQFSNERLNELDYLTDQPDVSINNVISVSDDYHENLNQFNKIVINKAANQEKIDQAIKPQLEALQQTQNQIVAKIDQSEQQEVKIIVKTAIKESQDALITAVETVKIPLQAESDELVKNHENADESNKIVEELAVTIESLKTQNEELTQEIITDETELKETNATNLLDNAIAEENSPSPTDPELALITPAASPEEVVYPEMQTWYYSTSCDFVSKTPGKDPVCGEDLIPVDSLPPDHSFFTKYSYDELNNKYVQKLANAIETIENNQTPTENPEKNTETVENSEQPVANDSLAEEIVSGGF